MTFRSQAKWTAAVMFVLIPGAQSVSASVLAAKRNYLEDHSYLVGIVLGVAFAAAAVAEAYLAKVRAAKLQAFAIALGGSYHRRANEADAALPDGCSLASIGGGRKVSNILEAVRTPELAFTLFDYEYTMGKSTREQTISRMESSLLHLPSFVLFPETIFFKLGEKIVERKDIDFSDSPVFSEAFVLRGKDEPAIRTLFSAKLRQALEATPDLMIEGNAERLFIFRENYRCKPEEFSPAVERDKRILALFFEAQAGNAPAAI
ncbi:MAG: hypothetical protein ACJ8M4_12345 [Chthoniobacterales bacterium]